MLRLPAAAAAGAHAPPARRTPARDAARPACRAPAASPRLSPAAPARLRRCGGTCGRPAGRRRVAAASADASTSSPASEAVAAGLAAFQARKHADAVQEFTSALALSPSEDEARAALYNRACALTALSRFPEAAADVEQAVNTYRLKYAVVDKDPDLAALRASPAFAAVAASLTGAASAGALTSAASVRMRAEAKSPFRTLKLFLLGGLGGGAAIGGFVTAPALLKSALALPGAGDLLETGRNLAIDVAVLVGAVVLFRRELAARATQEALVAREEALGGLRLAVTPRAAGGKSVTVKSLRGSYRPVVFTGGRAALKSAARAAEPYKRDLQSRGVLLVPLDEDDVDAPAKPKGFGAAAASSGAAPSPEADSGAEAEARWRLPPLDGAAWREWAAAQRAAATPPLPAGSPFYAVVALDGTVCRSGAGEPKWSEIVAELQPLESAATKMTGF